MMPFAKLPQSPVWNFETNDDLSFDPQATMNPNAKIVNNQIINPNVAAGRVMTPDQYMASRQQSSPMTYEEMIVRALMGAPGGTGM